MITTLCIFIFVVLIMIGLPIFFTGLSNYFSTNQKLGAIKMIIGLVLINLAIIILLIIKLYIKQPHTVLRQCGAALYIIRAYCPTNRVNSAFVCYVCALTPNDRQANC